MLIVDECEAFVSVRQGRGKLVIATLGQTEWLVLAFKGDIIIGVMMSLFRVRVITLATLFWTRCNATPLVNDNRTNWIVEPLLQHRAGDWIINLLCERGSIVMQSTKVEKNAGLRRISTLLKLRLSISHRTYLDFKYGLLRGTTS